MKTDYKDKQTSAYGNPQLNIRLERDIFEKVKQAAESEGLKSPQEWARRVILAALGEDSPISVNRSEFENAIAALRSEIESLKEQEPVG